jgi:LysM repeat protein
MELSHTQARTWLQHQSDHNLPPEQHALLAEHLRACPECSRYDKEISEAESGLRSMLKRRWSSPPPRLDRAVIHAGIQIKTFTALPGRLAVALSVLIGLFTLWQFSNPKLSGGPLALNIAPIPTPSLTGTATQADCALRAYTVAPGDTLAGIAERFALPLELLQQVNQLPATDVFTGDILLIPVCPLTPTSTLHSPTRTITPTQLTFTIAP